MYLLINLAVGGWPGTPPGGQSWPDTYECDWVRVYQIGSPENRAPVFTSSSAPTVANTGTEYSHIFTASDLDSDPLTFSAPTLPSWLTFNIGSGLLSGTTDTEGVYPVVISVTDGTDVTEQSFSITVTPPAEQGDNIVVNGDFETGDLTGWDTESWDAVIESADVNNGSYSGKMVESWGGSFDQILTMFHLQLNGL